MPTNYMFGSGRPSTLSNIVSTAPRLSSAVQQSVLGIKSSPVSSARAPRASTQMRSRSALDNASSDSTRDVRNANQQINDFGQSITQLKQAAFDKRQAKLDAQRQQSISAFDSRNASVQQQQGSTQPVSFTPMAGVSGARAQLVRQAQSLLGTPYAWGGGGYGNRSSRGTGKGTQNVIGVDCSGLTSYVYGTIGVRIARQSDAQLRTSGYRTSINNLKPGDLVGWAKGGHVALYIGNGQIIEAPKPGSAVRVRSLGSYDYNGGVYGVHVKLPGD